IVTSGSRLGIVASPHAEVLEPTHDSSYTGRHRHHQITEDLVGGPQTTNVHLDQRTERVVAEHLGELGPALGCVEVSVRLREAGLSFHLSSLRVRGSVGSEPRFHRFYSGRFPRIAGTFLALPLLVGAGSGVLEAPLDEVSGTTIHADERSVAHH